MRKYFWVCTVISICLLSGCKSKLITVKETNKNAEELIETASVDLENDSNTVASSDEAEVTKEEYRKSHNTGYIDEYDEEIFDTVPVEDVKACNFMIEESFLKSNKALASETKYYIADNKGHIVYVVNEGSSADKLIESDISRTIKNRISEAVSSITQLRNCSLDIKIVDFEDFNTKTITEVVCKYSYVDDDGALIEWEVPGYFSYVIGDGVIFTGIFAYDEDYNYVSAKSLVYDGANNE